MAPLIMAEPTLMGTVEVDRISRAELAAVRSLYGEGLGPGAGRADLVAAGLIGPLAAARR